MRLIDADALMETINHGLFDVYGSIVWDDGDWWIRHKALEQVVKEQPSVEAEPVRHGHWQITEAYPHNVYCSECHTKFAQTHWAVWEDGSLPRHYCPRCGARMDEVK